MNNSSGENVELSSRKYIPKGPRKRPGTLGRSKFKWKAGNGRMPGEYVPLLSVEQASDEENLDAGDEYSVNVRQRGTKCNGADFPNDEVSTSDGFLRNDLLLLDIKEGDTLQGISLQYHCPVSDLKRANHLISNQEFYALRQLRIPVKKYSLLMERLPLASNVTKNDNFFYSTESGHNVQTVNIGIGPISSGSSQEDAVAFFKRMDEDLVKIMQNTKSQKDSLEDATIALTSPTILPLVEKKSHSGVDCGIRWCYLVTMAILIGLIIPVIAIGYVYTYHSEGKSIPPHNSGLSTVPPLPVNNFSIKS